MTLRLLLLTLIFSLIFNLNCFARAEETLKANKCEQALVRPEKKQKIYIDQRTRAQLEANIQTFLSEGALNSLDSQEREILTNLPIDLPAMQKYKTENIPDKIAAAIILAHRVGSEDGAHIGTYTWAHIRKKVQYLAIVDLSFEDAEILIKEKQRLGGRALEGFLGAVAIGAVVAGELSRSRRSSWGYSGGSSGYRKRTRGRRTSTLERLLWAPGIITTVLGSYLFYAVEMGNYQPDATRNIISHDIHMMNDVVRELIPNSILDMH